MTRRARLTRRGWAMVAGSVLMVVAGRLLGVVELYVLATGAALLVVSGVVLVVTRSFDLDATRHLYPPRVHAGDDSRVELVIRNRGRSRTPVLALQDALGAGPERPPERGAGPERPSERAAPPRRARFLVPPLGPGQEDRASYRLPTEHRGVFSIGPLEASVTDAFGVATRATDVAPVAELVVYPHVDTVFPLSHTAGGDQMATSSHPSAVGPSGYDFYALRGYQVGDDLRRVHWPSTARRDELMIRQQELPWQGRATVVLDTRRRFHTDASFESAVSAAASILTACWRDGSAVRLLSTDGADAGFGTGQAHLEGLLSRLAFVEPGPTDHVERLASVPPPGGSVAVVATSDVPVEDVGLLGRLAGRSGGSITVVVDATRRRPPVVGGAVVRVTATSPFPDAWNATVGAATLGQGAHR